MSRARGAMCAVVALALALALPAAAQVREPVPAPAPRKLAVPRAEMKVQVKAQKTGGAWLRGLDKIGGQTTDLRMATGETIAFGGLSVLLGECRAPASDPDSDAFAELTVTETATGKQLFSGWMVASSPALSALDHPRYDVWVVACTDGSKSGGAPVIEYVPEPDGPVPGGEGADENPGGVVPPADPEGGDAAPTDDANG